MDSHDDSHSPRERVHYVISDVMAKDALPHSPTTRTEPLTNFPSPRARNAGFASHDRYHKTSRICSVKVITAHFSSGKVSGMTWIQNVSQDYLISEHKQPHNFFIYLILTFIYLYIIHFKHWLPYSSLPILLFDTQISHCTRISAVLGNPCHLRLTNLIINGYHGFFLKFNAAAGFHRRH